MAFELYEEDLKDKEKLGEKLTQLASIVYTKHYYASFREKEDLIAVGTLKAYSLICGGAWDKSRGPLLTYLYTGIRNEMHNYLYHANKEVCYNEFFEDSKEDDYFEDDLLKIPFSLIREVCHSFGGHFGHTCKLVVNQLNSIGFKVVGCNCRKFGAGKLNSRYSEDFYKDLAERLAGAVIWKSQESYLS